MGGGGGVYSGCHSGNLVSVVLVVVVPGTTSQYLKQQ